MFRGLYEYVLDNKGRAAFPPELRASLKVGPGEIEATLIIAHSPFERCLSVVPKSDFESQAQKIRTLPSNNPALIEFKRVVIASSHICSFDKAGRITLPRELREYARLEREIVWAGIVDKIELWSKTLWDEQNNKRLKDKRGLENLRVTLEKFGI